MLAGIARLTSGGIARVGLVGHSFGGAVVICAGARSPSVATVGTLATQSYGADEVARLAPRPLLLVHGTEDSVLPAGCSTSLFNRAGRNARVRLLQGAGHVLDEAAGEVHDLVRRWLLDHLARPGRPTGPTPR